MPSLKAMLRPSLETYKLWRKTAQAIIYLDVATTLLCIIQIPTSIAGAAGLNNWWILFWSLPPAIVTLAISVASIFSATRRRLHPTFAVIQSCIMMVGWAGCLFWISMVNTTWALGSTGNASEYYGPGEDNSAGGALWVEIACALLTVLLYIPYLVLSCMAVQRHRNIKRDMAHQSATVNLEEFAPREDSTFRPKDNDQV